VVDPFRLVYKNLLVCILYVLPTSLLKAVEDIDWQFPIGEVLNWLWFLVFLLYIMYFIVLILYFNSIRLFFSTNQVKIKCQHNDKNYIDGEKRAHRTSEQLTETHSFE
jgi:hypothetical protein